MAVVHVLHAISSWFTIYEYPRNMQFHVNHIKNNVFWHLSMHNNTHKIPDLHTQKIIQEAIINSAYGLTLKSFIIY